MAEAKKEQAALTAAEPHAEHRWLRRLLGAWSVESGGASAAGMPAEHMVGTETVREFGNFWVLTEAQGEVGDLRYANRMTLGFDPQKRRFVGTFIDSEMTFLWVYDGWLEGDVLTLESDGPRFDGREGMAKYRDIVRFLSEDHRLLRSEVLGDDGEWREFMVMHYRRRHA